MKRYALGYVGNRMEYAFLLLIYVVYTVNFYYMGDMNVNVRIACYLTMNYLYFNEVYPQKDALGHV